MNKFFFGGMDVEEPSVEVIDKEEDGFFTNCSDITGARNYSKGKSFRFLEWQAGKYYVNDEFYQDLVKYYDSVWICVNSTFDKPGFSNDWVKFVSKGDQGEKGEQGEKGDSGNGNFDVGLTEPNYEGFVNDVYLNLSTGSFYKYNTSWEKIGEILIEDFNVSLEWKDD